MKIIVRFFLFIIFLTFLALLMSSCSGNYWREVRNTGSANGKVGYNRAAWPRDHKCSTFHSTRPIQYSSMKRQYFAPKHITQ